MSLQRVPPSPDVLAGAYEDYLREGQSCGLMFEQYLLSIGLTNEAHDSHGRDDGVRLISHDGGPELVSVPSQATSSPA